MKLKLILLACTIFTGIAQAEDAKVMPKMTKSETECETKCATKCDKAKLAAKTDCEEKCDLEKAKVTHITVAGMTCGGCTKKLNTALVAVKGVQVKKICHKSGCVDVVLSEGATATQVKKVITKSGFKVTPEKKVKG